MKLKDRTKRSSRKGTDEVLLTLWQGGRDGDRDAVQVFEDELSPTTEDHASELLREAAPATVHIESVS